MREEFFVSEEGQLDESAAGEFGFLSIGQIRRAISEGTITLNGNRASPSAHVAPGDVVAIEDGAGGMERIEPAPPAPEVLFDDESVIAVDKPAGVSIVPERGTAQWPFMGMLLYHAQTCDLCRGVRFRIVHRLDRDTSGVVIIAKTLAAGQTLTRQFALGHVRKRYRALVQGVCAKDSGVIDAPIVHAKRGRVLMAVGTSGKPSVTEWRVAERFKGYALLDVLPRTGRTHQIRVHLAHAGLPLAVDEMYAGSKELKLSAIKRGYKRAGPETPLASRLTLHCAEITFAHPVTGESINVAAPLPEDLRRTLKALGKWAACEGGNPRADALE